MDENIKYLPLKMLKNEVKLNLLTFYRNIANCQLSVHLAPSSYLISNTYFLYLALIYYATEMFVLAFNVSH